MIGGLQVRGPFLSVFPNRLCVRWDTKKYVPAVE
jgi:hypothetical protein